MVNFRLYNGDCLEVLRGMDSNSIDSCVTDPPYGISFMGKDWDNFSNSKNIALGGQSPANEKSGVFKQRGKPIGGWSDEDRKAVYNFQKWTEEWSKEVYRVLKPGSFLLSFCSPRMYHRMVCGIEDSGFEIRDQIMWLYGSGFPKSHNISKAIDKEAGAERKVIDRKISKSGGMAHIMKTNVEQGFRPNDYYKENGNIIEITAPTTDEAKQWDGWGTALKPAHEPIVVARKPLSEKSVAKNVLEWGVGGINIDGCRVEATDVDNIKPFGSMPENKTDNKGFSRPWMKNKETILEKQNAAIEKLQTLGRWPANIIHDGSEEVISHFPNATSGTSNGNAPVGVSGDITPMRRGNLIPRNDSGSAARFFYCAKASKVDRGEGNVHPTVKPTELMKYLCRLVTPKGGVVLDPFMGSGSTGKAAGIEGFNFVGIEMDSDYFKIAESRISSEYNRGLKFED